MHLCLTGPQSPTSPFHFPSCLSSSSCLIRPSSLTCRPKCVFQMTWQRSPRCYFQGQRALFGGWACGGVGITDPGKGCVFVFVCVVGWGDVGLSPTRGCQKPKKRHDPKAVLMECSLLPGQREGPEDQEASARRPAGTAPSQAGPR